jgi:hypothetical protein
MAMKQRACKTLHPAPVYVAGERLRDMLIHKFNNNRNALRDWYEAEVAGGRPNRAWSTVERYLGVVLKYGERAPEVFEERTEKERGRKRQKRRRSANESSAAASVAANEINDLEGNLTTASSVSKQPKSEYEQRRKWLSEGDYWWFRGKPEWRQKWLSNRGLKSVS